ncbi:MAG: transporter, partial [Parasphingorhabdus sp.]
MKNIALTGAIIAACSLASPALAHDVRADDHAPIGVMADHTHKKGEIMFSLRYMHMEMSGNQIGTDSISNDDIVTTIPNRFAGMPMQPPTLRLVPQSMRKDMVMLGAMYSPADWITLVAMVPYSEKESTITTYAGPTGTTVLGDFQTNPRGIGDVSAGAIFPLLGQKPATSDTGTELNLRAVVGIPTGSIDETGQTLTPMNTQPTMVMPYGMQSGSGTWDLKPALTLKKWAGKWSFGAQ